MELEIIQEEKCKDENFDGIRDYPMTVVAQSQQPDMKKVFSHPLGLIPRSLLTADSCLSVCLNVLNNYLFLQKVLQCSTNQRCTEKIGWYC